MSQRPFSNHQPGHPGEHPADGDGAPSTSPIRPATTPPGDEVDRRKPTLRLTPPPTDADQRTNDVLATLGDVSRRITDLARELDCLGYFNDHDGNRPRAA